MRTPARSLFRKALPDVRGSFNPVQMESILKNRIAGLRGGGENDATFPALHLLQDMHAAVPGLPRHPPRPPEPRRPPLRAQRNSREL